MKLIIKGFVIGIAKIIPGVSGSMLAMTLNIYDRALDSLCNFNNDRKENFKFISLLSIGIILAIIIFSKIIKYLLVNYYLVTMLFFIGLIIGSTKVFMKEITFNKNSVILVIISFILSFLSAIMYIGNDYILKHNFIDKIMLLISGFIESFASIVPGISGTMLLINLGTYHIVINIISNITSINFIIDNIDLISTFFIGSVVGALITILVMKKILNKYKNNTYSIIFGICLSNIMVLIIKLFALRLTVIEFIVGLILSLLGYIIGIIL